MWLQAADELAGTQVQDVQVPGFLEHWSSTVYVDEFSTGRVEKRFGLARSTTLLHVMSGGMWPICDSRVRRAFNRITGMAAGVDVAWYLSLYVPFFSQLAMTCGAEDPKAVDDALFVYGRKKSYF